MKTSILALFFTMLTLSFGASSEEVDKANPYKMIKEVADITFTRFANERNEIRKNPNMLKDIVREELMPYVDYKYAAFKVLGTYLKKTTKEERGGDYFKHKPNNCKKTENKNTKSNEGLINRKI